MHNKITHDEFVKIIGKSHPNLTILSEYKGDKEYIEVKCNTHNYIFMTKPNWLKQGRNCKFCAKEKSSLKRRKTIPQLLYEFNQIHCGKYSYPYLEDEYKNNKSYITIICPLHGDFKQRISKHLEGNSCPKCSHNSKPYTNEEWINLAIKKHGNTYDYKNVIYKTQKDKVMITCKIHGNFFQSPKDHLQGCGCPLCKESHLEKSIRSILDNNNISYEYECKKFTTSNKSIDFYLPQYKIAIECQGEQHFKSVEFFGGTNKLEETIRRDICKYEELVENGINTLYVSNKRYEKISQNKKFNSIYKNLMFIEDIEANSNILLDCFN